MQSGAELVVGTPGSGAGQIASPRGVAVDQTSGRLIVADRLNERIDVFDADTGAFVLAFGGGVADGTSNVAQICSATCFAGIAGSGPGEFQVPRGVAVDNEAASPSAHDFYINDSGNHRVQEFSPTGSFILTFGDGVNQTTGGDLCTAVSGNTCGAGLEGQSEGQFNAVGGIAIGPGGVVYVADRAGSGVAAKSRVQKYSPEGAYLGQLLLDVEGGSGEVRALAVDSSGNLYLGTDNSTGALRKYDPTGNLLWTRDPSFNISSVAVAPSGRVFIGDQNVTTKAILEFDSAGNQLRTFYGSLTRTGSVVASAPYESANGDIFAAETGGERVRQLDFPPPGPIVYPGQGATFATAVSNVKATLHAEINPEGEAATYRFEYVDQPAFEIDGWASAAVKATPESASVGSDFALHAATAEIAGLTPETTYHFRAVATNATAPGGNPGPEATFLTKPPLAFGEVWSTAVGTDSATLHGEIDPVGIAATGYFEYVDQASFEASGFATAVETPAVGSGDEPLDFGSGEVLVQQSAAATPLQPGTTYHYRLIGNDHCKPAEPTVVCKFDGPEGSFSTFGPLTPPATECLDNAQFRTDFAAFLADCRAYEMVSPIDKHGTDIETASTIEGYPAALNQSAVDGGSFTYSTSRALAQPIAGPYSSQLMARRADDGWKNESISPQREGPSLFTTAGLDYQFKAFSPDLCLGWPLQDTAEPHLAPGAISGFPNLYRRDNCGPTSGSYEAITTVAPPNIKPNLFFPELQGIAGGKVFYRVPDKLTADARDSLEQAYEFDGGQLHLVCVRPNGTAAESRCSVGTWGEFGVERDGRLATAVSADGSVVYWSEGQTTGLKLYVRLDGQDAVAIASGGAEFWFAASDGSKAVYTVGEQLFEFDLATESSTLIANGVLGVAGGSADLAKLYFVSTKNLAAGATLNKPNLYRREGTTIRFVAGLTSADMQESHPSPTARRPTLRTSRITPDGDRIVFMSTGRPTGYDNSDAASGKPDAEVFLFDAAADAGAGRLSCISCNPTGSRPLGGLWGLHAGNNMPVAGNLNVWENQLYAPRILSADGGRIFFNSFDALVAGDSNERQDVYEWEAPGTGDCDEASPSFVTGAAGCLTLVSSGESSRDSEFIDASPSGDDVFFKTASSLVARDPGLLDVYDARVGGGFPEPPPAPAECEGESCLRPPAPSPAPTVSGSEAVGPGNPIAPAPKPKHCHRGKHKVKKNGKSRCVKNHKKHKQTKQPRGRSAR